MHPIVFLPLFIAVIITISACAEQKGIIAILENPNGKGFSMELKNYSAKNKCTLSLTKDDELQIEVAREGGEIALTISGKNGGEPYTGNDLQSGVFTVTVSETDDYVFSITGSHATGNITVTNLGNRQPR